MDSTLVQLMPVFIFVKYAVYSAVFFWRNIFCSFTSSILKCHGIWNMFQYVCMNCLPFKPIFSQGLKPNNIIFMHVLRLIKPYATNDFILCVMRMPWSDSEHFIEFKSYIGLRKASTKYLFDFYIFPGNWVQSFVILSSLHGLEVYFGYNFDNLTIWIPWLLQVDSIIWVINFISFYSHCDIFWRASKVQAGA